MWNREEHIKKNQPVVDKLLSYLKTQGIESHKDPDLNLSNVIFTKGKFTHKVAEHCLYRFSGMCRIEVQKGLKKNGEPNYAMVDMPIDMYVNKHIMFFITLYFQRMENPPENG